MAALIASGHQACELTAGRRMDGVRRYPSLSFAIFVVVQKLICHSCPVHFLNENPKTRTIRMRLLRPTDDLALSNPVTLHEARIQVNSLPDSPNLVFISAPLIYPWNSKKPLADGHNSYRRHHSRSTTDRLRFGVPHCRQRLYRCNGTAI